MLGSEFATKAASLQGDSEEIAAGFNENCAICARGGARVELWKSWALEGTAMCLASGRGTPVLRFRSELEAMRSCVGMWAYKSKD